MGAPPVTFALLIVVAVSAAPIKIAIVPLSGQNMGEQALDELSRRLAAALEHEGFTVTSPQTTAAALGNDAAKFTDAQVSDLARTLAVELVAVGNVARSGRVHQFDLRVLNASDAAVLATHSRKVRSMSGMQAELKRAARSVSAVLRPTDQPIVTEVVDDSPAPKLRSFAWAPALGAAVLSGAGTYFLLQSQDAADDLSNRRMTEARAATVADSGRQSESLSWASFMLAGGALTAAAAMYFLSSEEEDDDDDSVSFSVALSSKGAFAGVRWELP